MTEAKLNPLQKKILRKREQRRKISLELDGLCKQLDGNCNHPVTQPYRWEWDSGYGSQHMRTGKRCEFCGWVDLWDRGQFVSPSQISV